MKGTEVIKRALEGYHTVGSGAGCTILNQIAEDDWIAFQLTNEKLVRHSSAALVLPYSAGLTAEEPSKRR